MNIKLYRCFRNKDHQKDSDQKGDLIQCTLKVRKFYDINLFKNLISIKKNRYNGTPFGRVHLILINEDACMQLSHLSVYVPLCAECYAQYKWCLYKRKQSNCVLFFFTIKHLTNKSDLNSIKLPKCPYRRTKFSVIF